MEEYNRNTTEIKIPTFGTFELVAAAGFFVIFISNFLSFAPIEARTWREIGVGMPVMLGCIFGIVMILQRQFFSSFFVGMFTAFFITHEIIICYDNKAVEMGKELTSDGFFRSVVLLFQDALNPSFGSFWALTGVSVALAATFIGWLVAVYRENQKISMITMEGATVEDVNEEWIGDLVEEANKSEEKE